MTDLDNPIIINEIKKFSNSSIRKKILMNGI